MLAWEREARIKKRVAEHVEEWRTGVYGVSKHVRECSSIPGVREHVEECRIGASGASKHVRECLPRRPITLRAAHRNKELVPEVV